MKKQSSTINKKKLKKPRDKCRLKYLISQHG